MAYIASVSVGNNHVTKLPGVQNSSARIRVTTAVKVLICQTWCNV